MNTATLLRPAEHVLDLPTACPVRSLDCDGAATTELRVLEGRVWLTREGWPDDLFLGAGESLSVAGPARLHLSAEGLAPARLGIRAGP